METPVVELIKGLVQVRDGLSLIAFLSLISLVAFRTDKVPELLFGLLRDKLTRQQFSAALHRFMTLGFAAFLTLAALTVAAQILNSRTQPGVPTETAIKNELADLEVAIDKKLAAQTAYLEAENLIREQRFHDAINKLNQSIKEVPTLAAHETLIYVYAVTGNASAAAGVRAAAVQIALLRGDTLALVRLQRGSEVTTAPPSEPLGPERVPVPAKPIAATAEAPAPEREKPSPSDAPDGRLSLPQGGVDALSSPVINSGSYVCMNEFGCDFSWFSITAKESADIVLMVQGPQNGENSYPRIEIFAENGGQLPYGYVGDISVGLLYKKTYSLPAKGRYFLRTKAERDAILDIFYH